MNLDLQTIQQACKTHGSQRAAAKALGVSSTTIWQVLRANDALPGRERKIHPPDALAAYEKFGSVQAAAKSLEVSPPALNYILKAHYGLTFRIGGPPIHKLPMDTIAQEYASGQSMRQLGRTYGVDPEVIRRRLARKGIVRRPRGAPPQGGETNPQWKGGYKAPMHYYRRQSYEVAAICLGQPLPQGVVIHHMDENPENNHPSNLVLFLNQSLHCRYHQRQLKNLRSENPIPAIQLALESGAVPLPEPADLSVFRLHTDQQCLSDTELLERLVQRASKYQKALLAAPPIHQHADPQE